MIERKLHGDEHQSGSRRRILWGINPIAKNRGASFAEVNADLMLAAGFQRDPHERDLATRAQRLIFADCFLAMIGLVE